MLLTQNLLLFGCGTVDPGTSGLASSTCLPDPRMFALQLYPVLSESCGTANCHGQPGPLIIPAATSGFPTDVEVSSPEDLVEPFRSSYYSVIQHCDLKHPDKSLVVTWATGQQSSHPGGAALSSEDLELLLQWIRSGGAK